MSEANSPSTKFKDFIVSYQLWLAIGLSVMVLAVDHFASNGTLITSAVHEVRKDLYVAISTIAGALLGFVVTAFSIVVSLSDSDVMEKLRRVNMETKLYQKFTSCTVVLGITTLLSLCALIFDKDSKLDNWVLEYFVFFCFLWSSFAMLGIVYLIETLVTAKRGNAGSVNVVTGTNTETLLS